MHSGADVKRRNTGIAHNAAYAATFSKLMTRCETQIGLDYNYKSQSAEFSLNAQLIGLISPKTTQNRQLMS